MNAGYLLALTTGLLGGFGHCIGMCGPVVASYALAARPSGSRTSAGVLVDHLLYNAGRVMTYACIGAVMGLTGSFVNVAGRIAGFQNIIAMTAGIMMIVMGMSIAGIRGATAWIEQHNLPVLRIARQATLSDSPLRFLLLGLILGLLPCGLSYTIFLAAAASGSALGGMVTALLFGLGTLPALLVFGTVLSSLSAVLRGAIYRAGGVIVMIMGVYFLLKGLRLYGDL
jgi:sulfite exporter TauE/SafE